MKLTRISGLLHHSVAVCLLASVSLAQVTFDDLVHASQQAQNWVMYSGDYAGRHYAGVDQINTKNVIHLVPKWVYQTMAEGKFETTPLAIDGVLYGTAPDDRVFALDARSGRPIWEYQKELPADLRVCCGRVKSFRRTAMDSST